MKKVLLICMSILTASLVCAADETAAAEKNKPGADQPPIELKNRSVFTLQSDSRNPFWPIGWKPTGRISNAGAEHAGSEVSAGAFVVSTITLDPHAHCAIINGKTMFEGQQFGLQMGTQTYQITVKRIEDGCVILGRRDQEIVVPLRRK
jgi:hypothetical protein